MPADGRWDLIWRLKGQFDMPETLHDTFNLAIILQHFTISNYELFCKCNVIPLGAHFIYLNSGSLLGLKMAKIAETCRPVKN